MSITNILAGGITLLLTTALSADATLASANPKATESPLSAWSETMAAADFSGSVLIARGGDVLFEQGFGLADTEHELPFTSDTVVDVLSLTKQFTAAAILKLEEQGALSVTDTLDHFFDGVPDNKRSITLHQLLTHTSGLKANYKHDYRKATRDDLQKHALNSRLRTEPGTEYHYSNLGYSLLGIVIENVSGQSYEAYLHKHLLAPAGMTRTGYRIPDWSSEQLAVGYRSRTHGSHGRLARVARWLGKGNRWGTPLDQYWAEDGPWWSLRANGGLLSTLNDLHLWQQALNTNLVLSDEQTRKMFTPHARISADGHSFYGYGWLINPLDPAQPNTAREIFHAGGNPYFVSVIYRSVEHDLLLLFATNDWHSVNSEGINGLIKATTIEFSKPADYKPAIK